jgi:hypothetical protein
MATGALPVATPLLTRAKVTLPGVADTVNDSDNVAVRVTEAVLDVIWAPAMPVTPPSPARTPNAAINLRTPNCILSYSVLQTRWTAQAIID